MSSIFEFRGGVSPEAEEEGAPLFCFTSPSPAFAREAFCFCGGIGPCVEEAVLRAGDALGVERL